MSTDDFRDCMNLLQLRDGEPAADIDDDTAMARLVKVIVRITPVSGQVQALNYFRDFLETARKRSRDESI